MKMNVYIKNGKERTKEHLNFQKLSNALKNV